jgi:hypothetical protein
VSRARAARKWGTYWLAAAMQPCPSSALQSRCRPERSACD